MKPEREVELVNSGKYAQYQQELLEKDPEEFGPDKDLLDGRITIDHGNKGVD